MNKLCPADVPCQSNADSGGTWPEQAVPDRVGNFSDCALVFGFWFVMPPPLALQLHLERIRVVLSNRVALKHPARGHTRNGPWTWSYTRTHGISKSLSNIFFDLGVFINGSRKQEELKAEHLLVATGGWSSLTRVGHEATLDGFGKTWTSDSVPKREERTLRVSLCAFIFALCNLCIP